MTSFRDTILRDPAKLAAEIANDVMASEADIADALRQMIRYERAQCLRIAAEYGGRDATEIAELIGARNFGSPQGEDISSMLAAAERLDRDDGIV